MLTAGSLGGVPAVLSAFGPAVDARPDLAAVHGTDTRAITRAAVAAIGGMRQFVSRGASVFVKPNIGWARGPAQGANTHPDVVAAVIEQCFEAGARVVTVADHTLDLAERCYRRSGIPAAARQAGARVVLIDPAKFRRLRLKGEFVREWEVYTEALDADTLINLPVAKHHSLCRLTGAMKNWFGAIGGRRADLHDRIHTAIVDLAQFFRPQLTLLDATRVMLRNGPQGGSLADVQETHLVAASRDQVAIDAFAAGLIGFAPGDIAYIREAHERRLGRMDLEALRIVRRSI